MTPERIMQIVSIELGLPMDVFYISDRKNEYVDMRCITTYLLRKHTKLSLTKIGAMMGGKDHTSISHYITRVEDRISTNDVVFTEKYIRCSRKLKGILHSNLHVAISNYKIPA